MRQYVEIKIGNLFQVNKGTVDDLVLWECFKAYIRGACLYPRWPIRGSMIIIIENN